MRSSTARASATVRYIATRSASVRPTDAASGPAWPVPPGSVTVIASSVGQLETGGVRPAETGPADRPRS